MADVFDQVAGDVFDQVAAKPKRGVIDAFKGAAYNAARVVNEANAGFLDKLSAIAQRIPHDPTADSTVAGNLRHGAQAARESARYWGGRATESGMAPESLPGKVYGSLGGAPMGIAEFSAGVPYAVATAGSDPIKALQAGAKRKVLGDIFHGLGKTNLTPVGKSSAMAGTMGVQTAAEGGSPQDSLTAAATGFLLTPPSGGGRSGVVRQRMQAAGARPEIASDLAGRGAADAIPQGPGYVTAERDPRVFSDTQGQLPVADSEFAPDFGRPAPPVLDAENAGVNAQTRTMPKGAHPDGASIEVARTKAEHPYWANADVWTQAEQSLLTGNPEQTPAATDMSTVRPAIPQPIRQSEDAPGWRRGAPIGNQDMGQRFGTSDRIVDSADPTTPGGMLLNPEILPARTDADVYAAPPLPQVRPGENAPSRTVPGGQFDHNDLPTAAVSAADSLAVPPSVKVAVVGTPAEVKQLIADGKTEGRVVFKANNKAYVIDPTEAIRQFGSIAEAKRRIKAGGDAESAVLGYPSRPEGAPLETAAVTKQGEILTDPTAIKQAATAGEVAYAAEGTPAELATKTQSVADAMAPPFPHQADVRAEQLARTLAEAGLPPEHPAHEAALAERRQRERAPDAVTGFIPAEHFTPTMDRAWQEHKQSNRPFTYAEIDIHNLGGLNRDFGTSGSDIHYRAMADIIKSELPPEAQPFRKGGDELGIIAPGVPAEVIKNALDNASNKIKVYVTENGLAEMPHTKPGKAPGTGINYGVADFTEGKSLADVRRIADLQVELAKKRGPNVVNSETQKAGAVTPGEQTGRTGSGVTEATGGTAKTEVTEPTLLHAGVHLPTLIKQVYDKYFRKLDPTAPAGSVKEFLDANRKANERHGSQPVWSTLRRALIDSSANVQQALVRLGDQGEFVRRQFDSISGASAKASVAVDAQREALKDMSLREQQAMGDLIAIDRDLAINKPGYTKIGGKTDAELAAARKTFQQDYKLTDKEMARVDAATKSYFDAWKNNTQRMLDAGLITADQKTALDAQDYSPKQFLEKIDPDVSSHSTMGGRVSVPDSGIKRLKQGSDGYFRNNPMRLLSEATARIETRIARNEANRALADLPAGNGIAEKASPNAPVPAGYETVSYMKDGKQQILHMKSEYAKEWHQNDPLLNSELATWLQWVSGAKVVRAMATGYNPAFLFTNTPRDMFTVWMQGKDNGYSNHAPVALGEMAKDMLTVTKDAWGRKGRYLDYVAQGGGRELLTHEGALSSRRENLSPVLAKVQKTLSYVNEFSEILTRLAYRERMIKNGTDPATASKQAAEYVDFSRGGTVTKAIDRMGIPYLNAAIQGTRSVARSAGRDPGAFAYKTAQMMLGVSGLYAINQMTNPQGWANVSDRDKAANFIIMLPKVFEYTDKDGTTVSPYIKIAKEQGMQPFMTVAELATHWANGGKPTTQQIQMALGTAVPISVDKMPPAAAALWTYLLNADTYKKEPVWKGKQEVEPFAEYTNSTNPVFVAAGKALTSTDAQGKTTGGLSPERLKASMATIMPPSNFYAQIAGNVLTDAYEKMNPSDRQQFEKTNYEQLRAIPGVSRLLGGAKDTEQFREGIREARVSTATQQFEVNKALDAMVLRFVKGGSKDAELYQRIQDYIGKQSGEARTRLEDRVMDVADTAALPDRGWWLSVKALQPEDRADQFKARLSKADPAEQQRMLQIANDLPGFISDRFMDRYEHP